VPDVFLRLDIEVAADWWRKEHRSYFLWEFGKPPEVVIEIVSNTEGEEDSEKKRKYALMRVSYYVIYDPLRQVMPDVLTIYSLSASGYERQATTHLPPLGLTLSLWEGTFEGKADIWLRWADTHGVLLPTGKEAAEQERQRAEQERQHAEQERQRAEQAERLLSAERQHVERLQALLRQAGIDPQ